MPTACSVKGLPCGLAKTVLSCLPSEALQNGSTETGLFFSRKKPLQPFLGVGVGGTGCSEISPRRAPLPTSLS